MKQFAKYMVILFCIVFVADRGLGYVFDKLYQETKVGTTGGKINRYLSLEMPPEVLIMGSSRAMVNVNPHSFNAICYNLGHEGMDDAFQTALLHIIISQHKAPKTILLHVDPEIYCMKDTDSYPVGMENLKYYYGKDSLVTQYTNEISWHEKFFFAFHLYRYNGRVIKLIKDYLETKSAKAGNGFVPMMPSSDDSATTIKSVAMHKPVLEAFRMNRLRYLMEFIKLCKSNNINLIFFTAPRFHEYSDKRGTFDSIVAANHIPYINYQAINMPHLQAMPSLWKDAIHLNSNGAQFFSDSLAKRIEPLLSK